MGIVKVAVLGLGPSLDKFCPNGFDHIIGVNDIWSRYPAPILVVLNGEFEFTPSRLKVIRESRPDVFYSQIVRWDYRPDFRKIEFLPGYPDRICFLDLPKLPKSMCSPFVACVIAWKYYNATEIHVFGVDMINHPNLNGELCRKIRVHFQNLQSALLTKNCRIAIYGDGILADMNQS
jgi:hypothetical protein